VDEQRDRFLANQRRHDPDDLTVDAQRLAAGRHKLQAGAGSDQSVGQPRCGDHDVLAVVQHHQHVTRLEVITHTVDHRLTRPDDDPERRRHNIGNERGIAHRREIDERGTIGKATLQLMGHFQRESSLADSARADEGEQSRADCQTTGLGELTPPTDKWRRLDRERVAPVSRAQRRAAGSHESSPLGRTQCERVGQPPSSVWIRRAASAAFQIGNATTAEAGARRECLL
jgi:hypothetical protein